MILPTRLRRCRAAVHFALVLIAGGVATVVVRLALEWAWGEPLPMHRVPRLLQFLAALASGTIAAAACIGLIVGPEQSRVARSARVLGGLVIGYFIVVLGYELERPRILDMGRTLLSVTPALLFWTAFIEHNLYSRWHPAPAKDTELTGPAPRFDASTRQGGPH